MRRGIWGFSIAMSYNAFGEWGEDGAGTLIEI